MNQNDIETQDIRSKVEQVLADIGEKSAVRHCSRLGSRKECAARPIKFNFTVGSSDHAAQVIRKARNQRTMDVGTVQFGLQYPCPDRT